MLHVLTHVLPYIYIKLGLLFRNPFYIISTTQTNQAYLYHYATSFNK